MNQMAEPKIRHADDEGTLRACFPLMRQLRPHLADADDFLRRVSRMAADRYRILAAWDGDRPVALAGYRFQENLVYGPFLYVDDLVTDETVRRHRLGARLLDELTAIAEQAGCVRLVLDTALNNALAHRFYCRQGLLTGAIRFGKDLRAKAA
ncbi:MAG TPA: GNAT family N-acetyltransferase [Rhodopila sp.]|nr:GNAT family N-acetyltransferase [Rhodopila sp.]